VQQIIQQLPISAGIYKYFNKKQELLYIGKAKNLKSRVKSYWRFTPSFHPNPSQSPRILKMLKEATHLEYLVVKSEEDALLLENTLIKQLNPKYNILLRDDKTYPYFYIDNSLQFPRFETTRKLLKGKDISYYGPFPKGGKALFNALYEIYPLVQKKSCLKGKKACLFYQIKKCLAPCEKKITPEKYRDILTQAKNALSDKKPLSQALEKKMRQLATQERFEEAKTLREMIQSLSSINTHSSSIDLAKDVTLDILAIVNGEDRGVIVKLFMREGKIISSSHSYFRQTHIFNKNEAYTQALLNFYTREHPLLPQQILLADTFENKEEVSKILSQRFSKKIIIHVPQRGEKKRLTTLAINNAKELLKKETFDDFSEQSVAHLFRLQQLPFKIESFDNSHLLGVATVGGMVVWNENSWEKKSYRRYELHAKDEYGQMREMLSRRIQKFDTTSPPNLWILDGGKANLLLAKKLLKEAEITLDVIAIAKEKINHKAHRAKGSAKDIIYTMDEIFELKPTDKRLQWIQFQRDEAHRYAILYHQNKKRKEDKQILLLTQKGIGKASVKKLIHYFGTFNAIEKASKEEIKKVLNNKI